MLIAEQDLERFPVEPLAVTNVTRHVHIGQELHFDAQFALSLAGFAAPTMYVKRETSGLVTAHLALREFGIQLPDLVEQTRIGTGVRTRRASDRRLVNVDDLIEMLDALDAFMIACHRTCTHQPGGESAVKDVAHQGGLARP